MEVVYYAHLVPICMALFLSIYLILKKKGDLLSRVFFGFVLSFCAWLILDFFAWLPVDYGIISFAWSIFDYLNVVFFILGIYFMAVFVRGKDVEWYWKVIGLVLTIYPLHQVVTGKSILLFNQQLCEATTSYSLFWYKNSVELMVVIGIIVLCIQSFKNDTNWKQIVVVGMSLLVFFVTFSVTDFLSVVTEVYEIGLYGLLVMPVFLGMIVYAIVKYKAFNLEVLTTQVLAVTLVLLVSSQFLFIQSSTNRSITIITFILAVYFSYRLIKAVVRDIKVQRKLVHANAQLRELDDLKSKFISIGTHQILNPVTIILGHLSMMREGQYGSINNDLTKALLIMEKSIGRVGKGIRECLDLSRISYADVGKEFLIVDICKLVEDLVSGYRMVLPEKVKISHFADESELLISADTGSLSTALSMILENSIKHVYAGNIIIQLISTSDTVRISILVSEVKKVDAEDFSQAHMLRSKLCSAVCQEIFIAHNGSISDDGTITLPRAHPNQKTNTPAAAPLR